MEKTNKEQNRSTRSLKNEIRRTKKAKVKQKTEDGKRKKDDQ